MSTLRGEQLAARYASDYLFRELDLAIGEGQVLAIVGRSGCGKSTLLNVLAGLARPAEGRVLLDGRDITGVPGCCSLMPQQSLLLPWRDLVGNAALALEIEGLPKRDARARVLPHLEAFGLAGAETLAPHELSGGMQRRVGLLRAWLHTSAVLLLDEPFGALDAITRRELHRWFGGLVVSTGLSAVLVTHDIDEALSLAGTLLVMRRGGAVESVPVPQEDALRADIKERVLELL